MSSLKYIFLILFTENIIGTIMDFQMFILSSIYLEVKGFHIAQSINPFYGGDSFSLHLY